MTQTLTQKLQQQLKDRNTAASESDVYNILNRNNYSLGEDLYPETNTLYDQMFVTDPATGAPTLSNMVTGYEEEEEDTNLLRALGKGVWSALDVAVLGLPAFGLSKLGGEDILEALQPTTTGERIATSLGGVAGFLAPFGVVRVVGGAAVRGVAKTGTRRLSKKLVDDAANVIKSDKKFVKEITEAGRLDEIDDIARALATPVGHSTSFKHIAGPVAGTKFSSKQVKHIADDAAARAEYVQSVSKSIPEYLRRALQDKKITLSDDAITKISKKATDMLGGMQKGWTKKFPATDLQSQFAYMFGNSKVANIAAHAVEEALLFNAVEIPMKLIQSNTYDGMEFKPGSAIGHATAVGAALGVIRLLPGGRSVGLVRGGWQRTAQSLRTRRNYASYNLTNPLDRIQLEKAAKNIFNLRGDLAKSLKNTKGGSTISLNEIRELMRTQEGARKVQKWLINMEREFNRKWWPQFLKETPKDIYGSGLRMFGGSLAFNYGMLFTEEGEGMPWSEKLFHVALGAVLSKSGKPLNYIGPGGRPMSSTAPRSRFYNEDYIKVDKLLNALETPNNSLSFSDIVNHQMSNQKELKPDVNSPDVQAIAKIFQENGFIVKSDQTIKDIKTADEMFHNPLYSEMAFFMEKNVVNTDTHRVKNEYEISNTEMLKFQKEIASQSFVGVDKRSINPSGTIVKTGIQTLADFNAVRKFASEEAIRNLHEIEKRAILDVYDIITGESKSDLVGGKGVIPLREMVINANDTIPDITRVNSFLNAIKDYDGRLFNLDKTTSNLIFLDSKMQNKIVEALKPYEAEITRFITGSDNMPSDRRVIVGDSSYSPVKEDYWYYQEIDKSYRAIADLATNSTKVWDKDLKSIDGKPIHERVNELINTIFTQNGAVVDQVLAAGGESFKGNHGIFVSNLHRALKGNIRWNQSNSEYLSGFITKNQDVKVRDVKELIDLFERNGINVFTRETSPEFFDQLKLYSFYRDVASFNRNDGRLLTNSDITGLISLMDAKLISPSFEITKTLDVLRSLNIDEYMQYIKGHLVKSEADLKKLATGNAEGMNDKAQLEKILKRRSDELGDVNTIVDAFDKLSEKQGTSLNNLLDEMLTGYQEFIEPLMRGNQGGFLKPAANLEVVLTETKLFEVHTALQAARLSNAQMGYADIISASRRAGVETNNNNFKKAMNDVERVMFGLNGNPRNIASAIRKLQGLELYNPYEKSFTFDPTSVEGILKKLNDFRSWADYEFKVGHPQELIRNAEAREREKFEILFPVDSPVSLTVDQFVSKYGLQVEVTSGMTVNEVLRGESYNKSMKDFANDLKGRARGQTIGDEKNKINYYNSTPKDQKQFVYDAHRLWHELRESVDVKNVRGVEGAGAFFKRDVMKKSPLYDIIKDHQNEIITVDMDYYTQKGIINTLLPATSSSRNNLIDLLANNPASIQVGFKERFPGWGPDWQLTEPIYTVSHGDVAHGYGIPVTRLNDWAQSFYDVLQSKKKSFKGTDREESFKSIFEELDKFSKGALDIKEDGTVEIKFRDAVGTTNDAQLMFDVVVNNSLKKDVWWDHLLETRGDGLEIAKHIRRSRMFSNESATRIRKDFLNQVSDEISNTANPWYVDKDKIVADTARRIAKKGFNIQLLDDESIPWLDVNKNLAKGIEKSIKDAENQYKEHIIQLNKDSNGNPTTYDGGRGTASKLDAVGMMTDDLLDMFKAISAIPRSENVESFKPLIVQVGDDLMLGKTLFTASHDFKGYLSNNDLDFMMVGTGLKMSAPNHLDKMVNNDILSSMGIKDIDAFMGSKVDKNFTIQLDAESVGLISTVAPRHAAAMPIHILNDITDINVATDAYNWMFGESSRIFAENVKQFTSNDATKSIARMKGLTRDLQVDNPHLSGHFETWLEGDGHPFAPHVASLSKNAIKKKFINDSGILTPKNRRGSMAVLTPDPYGHEHPKSLRDATFYKNPDTNEVAQYTFGQFSAPQWTRSLEFDRNNLMLVVHRKNRPDALVLWDPSVHGDLKGKKTLGEAFDVLKEMSTDKNVTYELMAVLNRTPSTRPSDKIIAGTKDFDATGGSARLNSADGVHRAELDFDVDKINIWWDTPESLVRLWEKNAGNPLSVGPQKNMLNETVHHRNSVNNLDWLQPETIKHYNSSSAKASFQRGVEVKARGLVQYLKFYNGSFGNGIKGDGGEGGFSFQSGRGRVVINWDKHNLQTIDRTITRDIQEIVDSTTGYDMLVHNRRWIDKILFGEPGNDEYPGLLRWEIKESESIGWVPQGKWSMEGKTLEQEIVKEVIAPYNALLQARSDIHQMGKSHKVRYDDMVDLLDYYRSQIRNLNPIIYRRLMGKRDQEGNLLFSKGTIDAVFLDANKKLRNIIDLNSAALTVNNFDNLLPFDRVMMDVASKDNMTPDRPAWMRQNMRNRFEKEYNTYFQDADRSGAIQRIVDTLKSDVANMGFLNFVERKIGYLDKIEKSHQRRGDSAGARYWEERKIENQSLRDKVMDKIVSDPDVASKLAGSVAKNIEQQVMLTGKYGKENIGRTLKERKNWLDTEGREKIKKQVWNKSNRKFAIRFKTIDDNEYLGMVIMGKLLEAPREIMINVDHPELNFMARDLEMDVITSRNEYRARWREYFKAMKRGKTRTPEFDMDAISELIQQELSQKYVEYNNMHEGLGELYVLKFMAPQSDPTTWTYFNGKISEGYTDTSPLFLKAGFKFLNDAKMLSGGPGRGKEMIRLMATQYTNLYRLFHGGKSKETDLQDALLAEHFKVKEWEGVEDFLTNEKYVRPDYDANISKEMDSSVARVFGMSRSLTQDYLTLNSTRNERFLMNLKDAWGIKFMPEWTIDISGQSRKLRHSSSYWQGRLEHVSMFLGPLAKKGLVRAPSEMPRTSYKYGEGNSVKTTTSKELYDQYQRRHNVTQDPEGGC